MIEHMNILPYIACEFDIRSFVNKHLFLLCFPIEEEKNAVDDIESRYKLKQRMNSRCADAPYVHV